MQLQRVSAKERQRGQKEASVTIPQAHLNAPALSAKLSPKTFTLGR